MVLFRRLLGDVLRAQRMQRGMTLREVSAEARVSLGYISEIERGQKEASSELLASLCAGPRRAALRRAARGLRRGRRRGGRRWRSSRARRSRSVAPPATSSPPPPDPLCSRAQRSGWQDGHQYAARSRPGWPGIADRDRRAAAPARRLSRR